MDSELFKRLEQRIGRVHAKQRLGIEADFETKVFGPGVHFLHLENWYSVHSLIRGCLRLSGLYGLGQRNTHKIRLDHHDIPLQGLPTAFDGFRILQISDPHIDINDRFAQTLIDHVRPIDYDMCVLTGDYRARTYGSWEPALKGIERLRAHLKDPVYGILGNHDSVRMVPALEDMGIRMLLNESVVVERDGHAIHLAGIDDAHFFRVDNIEKAAQAVPHDSISILLSHTPEPYRQAAHADFKVLLCGHTHGGQICLPGRIPLFWDARCPRQLAAGSWRYHQMVGYTSVGCGTSIVNVRLNCPPEITLHTLRRV
jgi:predicted MPP superfamily phosphohydrolase